ncbi:MAG TPA: ABC transporter substrate-binding protein [Candidatus Polarisedimenticolia bacterium]|nr:ABC transporter substrate-binding protein [Candidatus Polarisedimenticolia bacterium]
MLAAIAVLALCAGCPSRTPGPRPPAPAEPPSSSPAPPHEARESAPEEGGDATFALEDPFTTVSGARMFTSSDRILRDLAFHGLTRLDPGGKVEGELAEKWEALRGGSEWVFHLRPNTAFSNGRYVEARHVVASWEKLIQQSESLQAWLLEAVKGFEETRAGDTAHVSGLILEDGLTLRVVLKWPVKGFAARLAHPALGISAFGEDESGVGPFEIWGAPKATLIVVRSNAEYFRGLPHLDEIGFVRGEAASEAKLSTGQLDAAVVPPGDKPAVTPTTKVFGHAAGRTYLLGLDRGAAPFSNAETTAKFIASLDREAIRSAAGGESARFPEGLIDREEGHRRELSAPKKTSPPPAPATRLDLLLVDGDPVAAAVAGKLLGAAPKGGGRVIPHPVRASEFLSAMARREFHAFLLPIVRVSEDPLVQLESLVQLNRSIPDTVKSRLRELEQEADAARLAEGISQVEGSLIAEGYLVPLVTAPRRLLVVKGICGLRGDPVGMLDWTRLWKSRQRSGDCD